MCYGAQRMASLAVLAYREVREISTMASIIASPAAVPYGEDNVSRCYFMAFFTTRAHADAGLHAGTQTQLHEEATARSAQVSNKNQEPTKT